MATVLSYSGDISISLIFNNKETVIQKESVSSLVIDHNYIANNMPIMIINLNVPTNIYNLLIEHKDDGKILLNFKLFNPKSMFKIYNDKIKDQFTYKVPSNYDYKYQLQSANDNVDNSFNNITIGLFSDTLYNFNGFELDGVLRNVKTEDLLELVKGDRKFICDKCDNSETFEEFLIYPINSRSKLLSYIYNKTSFYNCDYIYYNDFDKSYIIKKENSRKPSTDKFSTVVLNVDKLNVESALYEGIEKNKDNNCYIIYLNGSDIEIKDNNSIEDIIGKIKCIDDDGSIYTDNITNSKYIDPRTIYIRGDKNDLNKLSTTLKSSKTILNITKSNIDSSILDLDKIYILNNFNEDFKKYNGKYHMVYKRDIYVKSGSNFNITTVLSLLKIDE